ncbi:unnamed protein product [Parascedosporium putredinis]|uniref:Uncharacterized protein n=1 Tax=Parascedosporium putredinis TaxID=1442378 RepID=A0A9P1GV69_9PEZI|nr:unnamed protein product [Parascedosporium putredinis]CAI7987948.1 unnamed protein product [Parascedosporium putredinis]
MKFTSIFVGTLATLAAAAPVKEFGSGFDVLGANNFGFNNLALAYLAKFNGFNTAGFGNLITANSLAFDPFAELFAFGNNNQFLQLNHILTLQNALVLSWLSNIGLASNLNFAGGVVPLLDFGNLNGFISPSALSPSASTPLSRPRSPASSATLASCFFTVFVNGGLGGAGLGGGIGGFNNGFFKE